VLVLVRGALRYGGGCHKSAFQTRETDIYILRLVPDNPVLPQVRAV